MQFYKMTKIVAVSALEMNENPFNIILGKKTSHIQVEAPQLSKISSKQSPHQKQSWKQWHFSLLYMPLCTISKKKQEMLHILTAVLEKSYMLAFAI